MSTKKIGLFVGSLRKASYSKAIARFIESHSNESFQYTIIEIDDLPLYNQDIDDLEVAPDSYVRFRKEVAPLDGVLFITPEYNRSVPAVLKNAIDVGSRPYGQSVWSGKPGAIISLSMGIYGGFGANHHLRQALVFLDVITMQQPECYLAHVGNSINEAGEVTEERLQKSLVNFIESYQAFTQRVNK